VKPHRSRIRQASPIEIVKEMIDRWPSRRTLAHDMQVSYWTVSSWLRRGWVPTEWWNPVLKSARRYGLHAVTLKSLESLPKARRTHALAAAVPTIKARSRRTQGAPVPPPTQSRAA
jgi:hypothetical protein